MNPGFEHIEISKEHPPSHPAQNREGLDHEGKLSYRIVSDVIHTNLQMRLLGRGKQGCGTDYLLHGHDPIVNDVYDIEQISRGLGKQRGYSKCATVNLCKVHNADFSHE